MEGKLPNHLIETRSRLIDPQETPFEIILGVILLDRRDLSVIEPIDSITKKDLIYRSIRS